METIKCLGGMKEADRASKEWGIRVYVNIEYLCNDTFIPVTVREKLQILVEEFGRESVIREVAKQMSGFG